MKNKKITVLFLDVKKGATLQKLQIEDKLENYQTTLGVDCIDIVRRPVGNSLFCFVVDDVGALDRYRITSAVNANGYPELFGNLIITGLPNDEGELTSLTQSDIEKITKSIRRAWSFILGKEYTRIRLNMFRGACHL